MRQRLGGKKVLTIKPEPQGITLIFYAYEGLRAKCSGVEKKFDLLDLTNFGQRNHSRSWRPGESRRRKGRSKQPPLLETD